MNVISLALQIVGALGGSMVPELVRALAGDKAADVASKIVNATTSALGSSDPAVIAAAAQADKDKALALIAAETERYRLQVSDTADARARDLQLRQSGGNVRANVMLIGVFAVMILVVLGVIVYRQSMTTEVIMMLGGVVGSCLTMLTQAFNFEFGSSRGSADKSDQLSGMIKKLV